MNLQKKSNNLEDNNKKMELMEIIAESMGAKVVSYTDVDDAIKKGISIHRIVSTESYLSKEEINKINQKYIGLFN